MDSPHLSQGGASNGRTRRAADGPRCHDRQASGRHARLPAITFDGHTTSYGDLLDQIDTLAAELAAGGVGRGDRVAYLGLNDPMFLITLFAAARIGAVFVPLNYRLTAAELVYILTDAGVHTLLADAEHVAAADPVLTEAGVRRALALSAATGWEPLPELVANRGRLAARSTPGRTRSR